jgi:hypothetical protein
MCGGRKVVVLAGVRVGVMLTRSTNGCGIIIVVPTTNVALLLLLPTLYKFVQFCGDGLKLSLNVVKLCFQRLQVFDSAVLHRERLCGGQVLLLRHIHRLS